MLFRLFRRFRMPSFSWRQYSRVNAARIGVEVLEDRALPQATPLGVLLTHHRPPTPAVPAHFAAPLGMLDVHKSAAAKPPTTTYPAIFAEAATWLASPKGPQQAVIEGPAQLLADTGLTTQELATLLGVRSINWNKEMVVLVSEGNGPVNARSPSVEISGLAETHGVLTVNWNYQEINPADIAPGFVVETDPAGIALVKRFAGATQFQQGPTVIVPPPPLVITDPAPLM